MLREGTARAARCYDPAVMDIPFQCRCGLVRGVVQGASPDAGHRAICYCDDCQTAAHALNAADRLLDAQGGSDIYQVPPSLVRLTQGTEHLRCLRLSPKGLMRWYAGCCDTPLVNSLDTPRSPFVGVQVPTMVLPEGTDANAALGPVRMRIMGAFAVGGCPPGVAPKFRLREAGHVTRVFARSLLWRMHRGIAFFDPATGAPIVTPRVLSRDERNAARVKAGQPPR